VLFGDADVEQAIRELLPNDVSPVGPGMAAVDGHDVAARLAPYSISASVKGGRPARRRDRGGQSSRRIDHPALVHLFGLVVSAGAYPMPLRVTTCTITGPP